MNNEAFQNRQENSQIRGRGTEVGLRVEAEIERDSLSFFLLISTICFVVAPGYCGNDGVPSKAMKWKIRFIAFFFLAPRAEGCLCSANCGFSGTKKLIIFVLMLTTIVVLRIFLSCTVAR